MAKDSGEKTEKPTPKKLKEARREGNIARSQDVGAWAAVLVASFLLEHTARTTMDAGKELFVAGQTAVADPDPVKAMDLLVTGLRDGALAVLPLALGLMAVGVAGTVAQGGFHISMKRLRPKAERLNPLKGAKRMFGPQAGWELVKNLLKTTVVAYVVWRSVNDLMPNLIGAGHLPLEVAVQRVGEATLSLVRIAAATALVLAAADYGVQWRRTRKQLMMSRKEIADEHKQAEGDPYLKGAIRSKALAMSRNRMMAAVTEADVLLVNPTHVAVALRYEGSTGAPRVVAKGAGVIAARLRALATEHRVPMVEDVPLARALHKACEIGQEIPPELYTAVARVLAFVLSLKARGSAAGLHRVAAQRHRAFNG